MNVSSLAARTPKTNPPTESKSKTAVKHRGAPSKLLA